MCSQGIFFFRKILQDLIREKEELDKVFGIVQSLENQKRDDEKAKKLQELLRVKGKGALRFAFNAPRVFFSFLR